MTNTYNVLKRTPFYNHHIKAGGKMVDFAGWDMPVQYTTISQEHLAVRESAGLFDISHMGQVFVWGPDALSYLQYLTTNNIAKIPVGKSIYAHLLNEKGGVIDDIFIYRLEEEKYLVIVNASRADVDLAWMNQHKAKFDVKLMEAPLPAALALQGPKSPNIMEELAEDVSKLPRFGIGEFEFGDAQILVARTGYTGEDGFELFAPAGHLIFLWEILFKAGEKEGLRPAGLGARDTLRTEVAYPLYGHELDETHTPFEAGLDWVVKLDKGDFIGRAALVEQKSKGLPSKLFGFKVESGGVARPGGKILVAGQEIGTVASGTFSPSLGYSIGMAFLPPSTAKEGARIQLQYGAREMQAVTVKTPFYTKKVATPY